MSVPPPIVGEIRIFPYDFTDPQWLRCDGQLVSLFAYSQLFIVIGTTYGGNGTTNFGIPDLRGRCCRFGTPIGEQGGFETHTLTADELPSHNHEFNLDVGSIPGDSTDPTSRTWAASSTRDYEYIASNRPNIPFGIPSGNSGLAAPFSIMQPFLALSFYIATGISAPP